MTKFADKLSLIKIAIFAALALGAIGLVAQDTMSAQGGAGRTE